MTRRMVSDEQFGQLCHRTEELHRRVDEATIGFGPTMDALQEIIEGKKQTQNDFLTLISGKESLILDSVDGKEILAEAKDVFGYIDSDFQNWGADEKGPATEATPVRVYEMTRNTNFSQMFSSLSSDIRKLCLTQAQIKNFAKKYRNWLRTDGYPTFLLFESRNHFFVACVGVGSGGALEVVVYRFGDSYVWFAEGRRRLVVPQLA